MKLLSATSVQHAKGAEEMRALTRRNQRYKTAVVVVAEKPYAEGFGDQNDLRLPRADVNKVKEARRLAENVVVVVLSGRPLLLGEAFKHADAVVAAWLPGTEGSGVVDVLTGAAPFTGTLPFAWPEVGGIGFSAAKVTP